MLVDVRERVGCWRDEKECKKWKVERNRGIDGEWERRRIEH